MEDRKRSISSTHTRLPSNGQDQLTPPWEGKTAVAVPFFDPHAAPSLLRERSSTSSPPHSNMRLEAGRQYDSNSTISRNSSQDRPNSGWQTSRSFSHASTGFASTSVRTTELAPAVTSAVPSGFKPLPRLPFPPEAPLSPPESKSDASSNSSVQTSPATKAMPGTMSSRSRSSPPEERKPSRSRPRRTGADKKSSQVGAREQAAVGRRLKLALKDFFKKDTIKKSEPDFERIESRHWADE